ncbi:D-glycero-D-manno-heptose 1,7-bisphosphate phosphatase [Mucilaginibacter pineti]|uniref:D,D-heptose 1,7-bisphosphate phosphatase n=1 Tax=Mucilaginibacter pineti TaxID=1391627 RepID=A0A1G6ZFC8_9SPHI|nr:HAD family hydrolase [Mucilaginibacter pineti]SDE01260.1 D-glycero-D-manno-heptose 1,7-bisphosphate phosphatase [Mucilaginibacter pineti]
MSADQKLYDTLFLDRDGVINKKIDYGYVLKIDDIEILKGVPDFLLKIKSSFRRIVIVTNQRCVGRKLISISTLEVINTKINSLTGNYIDRFYVCPHLSEENCNCRKPKIGLFLQALRDYPIDFENSWMVGDSETDLIPAKQLGIKSVFISKSSSVYADITVPSIVNLLTVFDKQS